MAVFRTENFSLDCGETLSVLDVAYEMYGTPAPDASNVILVLHGTTSTHQAAGTVTLDRRRGWWDDVIGPGKLFDTRHYAVVSSNMLGSCYGTTGPRSLDPRTRRPYGRSFPAITMADIVRAQYLLLEDLGVRRLTAVAGQAIGGLVAFQWAVDFPEFMAGVIATDCGPKNLFLTEASLPVLLDELSADPNWNGGDYYDRGGLEDAMTRLRIRTLESYQFEDKLTDVADRTQRRRLLERTARDWAREFDANSLVTLTRALSGFDVERQLHRIRARFLYVLADTDELYPASIGAETMRKLAAAGVDAEYLEVKSALGHYATTEEPEKWVPAARRFLQELSAA